MGGSSGVEETGWRERGGVRCGRESQGLTRQGGNCMRRKGGGFLRVACYYCQRTRSLPASWLR